MRPKWERAGEGSGSSGSGAPPPAPPEAPAAPPATPPPTPPTDGEPKVPPGYVPADQLRAVVAERDRLAREASAREEDEAKKRGEFETLASKREQERDQWRDRFITTSRRAAFVAAIAPEVPDAEAAYKLANADGLLNDIDVADDGTANAEKVAAAKKKTLETYKSIFGKDRSFGGERSGQRPESHGPNDALDPREQMRVHYEREGRGRS